MSRRGLGVVVLVGLSVAACGHSPAPPANQLAPGTIVWPSHLDQPSTPVTHREAAIQLLVEAGVKTAMVTMQEIMLKQQIELHPIIKPYENTLRAFFTKYISYEALKDEIAELYMSRFSELQLRQMVAFYQTPTGRLAAKELPAVMELAAEIGKRNVAKHMPELKEMLTHPDSASAPPAP